MLSTQYSLYTNNVFFTTVLRGGSYPVQFAKLEQIVGTNTVFDELR